MNILILGAGQVGTTLAEYLSSDNDNDITVVDIDIEKLRLLERHYDIKTVCGYAAYPGVLESADIKTMDMVIAVTFSDEHNMIACQMAHTLYHVKKKIARIRTTEYLRKKELFSPQSIPIDFIISPEILITEHIERIIENPGALQVFDFENGLVQLVTVKAYEETEMIGKAIKDISQYLPTTDMRIVGLYRDHQMMSVSGETIVNLDDEVYFITKKQDTKTVIKTFRRFDRHYKNIMIAGGGNIGLKVAEVLEGQHNLRVIERSGDRVNQISAELRDSLVLQGNATDEQLLLDEGIASCDLFLALTESDETNLVVSILAKKLGARKVITLVSRNIYVDLAKQSGDIDIVISPDQITAGMILSQIRKGDMMAVYSLKQCGTEAMEVIVHGDEKTSKVVGRAIKDIKFPNGVSVGCLVRGEAVLMGSSQQVIQSGDHVVLILTDANTIHQAEALFQEIN